jgi:hypothetical protein
MTEYRVPRSLDVPDRIGIPFFTTVQFFLGLAGVAIGVLIWLSPLEVNLRAWVAVWLPILFLLGPRSLGESGWTQFESWQARAGRWLRPKRTVWRP